MYKLKPMFFYTKEKQNITETEFRTLSYIKQTMYEKVEDNSTSVYSPIYTEPILSSNIESLFSSSNDVTQSSLFDFGGGESGGGGASGDW